MTLLDLLRHPREFNRQITATADARVAEFVARLEPGATVLDVGSGPASVLPDSVRVIRSDYRAACQPNVCCDALALPFASGAVDHVCCSWVFEHLEEPAAVLAEFHRVMRPGGYLYLTTNFAWHEHEAPRDFYRFSRYGLRHLLETNGPWQIELLEATAGFWPTLTTMLNYRVSRVLRALHPIVTLPVNLTGHLLGRVDADESLCNGYCVIARRA